MKSKAHTSKGPVRLAISTEMAFDEEVFQQSIYDLLGEMNTQQLDVDTELLFI